MKKIITISYLHRHWVMRDFTIEKIVLTNHYIKNISGFKISDKAEVEYSPGLITIKKLT
jgi:hypothetical protein